MNHPLFPPVIAILRRIFLFLIAIPCLASAQTPWLANSRTGDEARFLYGNQIQRYNLTSKSWLTAFTLPRSGATAMAADPTGGVVAYGTSVYSYGPGFGGETLIGTVSSSAQSVFLDGNLVIVVHSSGLYARVTIFNRATGAQLSTRETYVQSLYGCSHAPGNNRIYGRSSGISPSDINTCSYTDAGVVSGTIDSPYHGDYPTATRTWCFPDESRVLDSSGTVYTAPGLSYFGSFAGTVTDIAFNGDVPVVLRGGEVIAFSHNLLEAGRASAGVATGAAIQVTASEAFVFSPGTTNPLVNVIPLSSINAPQPGTPVNPLGLAYTVDQAFPDKDGNLLLFSKGQQSLFRWSPVGRQYTGSFPLLAVPKFAAYSAQNGSAYFAYDNQQVRKMDLSAATPKEVPFFNMPDIPTGLATAGEFIFASDPSGAWASHYIYSPGGVLTHSLDWNYYSRVWEWDPVKRRMYFFRDDTSPNDLHYETVDAAGKITGEGETPYHGDFTVTPPIRVSPDGTKVVIGSGVVFETPTMTKTATLSNGFSDAVWTGGKLVTLRLINGVTQLQTWEGTQLLPGATVRQFSGTPVRLFDTAQGLVVITSVEGTPRFTILDSAFATIYISPTKPVAPGGLAVTARTESSVALQWQDLSDNEDLFRVDYRLPAGTWMAGPSVAPGITSTTVTGLIAGTTYEFRVIAGNGPLESQPSATVTGKTLVSPDEPTGEPYNLKVTRIFNNRITLEWKDNANNESGFRILQSTTAGGATTAVPTPANATSFTVTSLAASTTYYFRVQVVNGDIFGDLSAQISAKTLASNSVPTSPGSLAAPEKLPSSVKLTWADNSTNEDSFQIERSASPATTWTTLGTVDFNIATFTDTTVAPNTAYTYRVKAVNAAGSSGYATATVTTPKLGGEFAGYSIRSGNVYHFAFTAPNRIERYDLAARAWLAPIPLDAAATALWADESAIFVAEGRSVLRFALAGGTPAVIANSESNVSAVFTIGNTLVFQNTSTYTSLDKTTGTLLATFSYSYRGAGHAVVPATRKVFFRSSNVSPSDIHMLEIGADGKLVKGSDSPYHGDYPSATRTFVFPNGARVADDSGTVYSTESLAYNNSLGGSFTDLDFVGQDVPVVLRGDKLLAYNGALLEAGSYSLGAAGLRVAVSGTDAVVFSSDGMNDRGLSVKVVPLSALSAPEPGTAVDPRGLAYTPDDVFIDKRGNVLLFSKSQLSLFRWSPADHQYLPTYPLVGAPSFAGYSAENDRAYFAYDSQVVREMDLAAAAPKEVPLFNLPTAPRGFTLAGAFPYAAVYNGLMTFTPAGANITTTNFTYYYGSHNVWDPVNRRVYHFRDGSSPNDLHYDTISLTGAITGGGETPYHGDFTMTKPIRVSPDGSKVVIGSGIVFNSNGLSKIASLANGFTDATWFGGKLVTARLISGVTQLQTWEEPQFVAGSATRQVSGTPVRLLALDSARLLLVTLVEGVPRFTILNTALEPTYISPTKPLAPSALAVTGRALNAVTLGWVDNSDNEDGFRVEYRTASGNWTSGAVAAANATAVVVTGLAPATSYEFRVSATLSDLSSAPSSVVAAATLSSPDEPVGEPYGLRITRIFSDSMTLEWQDNATNETGFRIIRSLTAGGTTTEISTPAGSTSCTVDGLAAGTTYFFRIQVVNGAISGDLSSQVSGITRTSNAAPSAPSGIAVTEKSSNSVKLTWNDNSANEETFQLERSSNPASVWTSIGSVPFNTTTFTDNSAVPNTAYSYRVKAVNASGSSSYSTTSTTTPKLGGEFAGYSTRAGNVYYFAFTGPNRIERYDLVSRAWLAAVPLQAPATALWADESGIFVAEDRAVIRFAPDGTGRTPIGNAATTVGSLFTLNDLLVFGPSGNLVSMNKKTGAFLADISYWYSGSGFSAVPGMNRAFFRSTGVSPSDIHFLEIGADGKLIKAQDSPYHGDYPEARRTFVFPNGARVADDSGIVYSTDSLSYTNSLGGAFVDLSFHGTDIPIVLRGNKLQAYTNTLLETGSFTLPSSGLRVAVSGDDALVFFADGTDPRGLRVQSVPLNGFSTQTPGSPVDPGGLAYTPDDVFVDRNGELLLFSKAHLSLFRWSPSVREYLPTLPLLGSPQFAAYSKQTHRAYFAYSTQVVREMDLTVASPVEKPLFTLPTPPTGLATAGEFVFSADNSGAWATHYVHSPAGSQLQAVDWNYYSRVWEWEPTKRRMYFFRDDTSPNDLHYETINAAGTISGEGETPYHGDFTVTPPIRSSADGSKVVIGSGVVFETAGMTRLTTLPNTFIDALWRGGELLTIRASGSQTEVQRWNGTTFAAKSSLPLFAGTPLRLLALNSNESALITLVAGVPRIYLLNDDLTVAFTYVSLPLASTTAKEDVPFEWTPNIQWENLGTGALTITAPVLPSWLTFANGRFTGTPREADSGDQIERFEIHRVVVRAVNSLNQSQEKELKIKVVWQNDAPVLPAELPPVVANDRADPDQLDLAPFLTDPDGRDSQVWEITGNSNPAIFSTIGVNPNGRLKINYAPYVSGSSTIEVKVTDASGASATTSFKVVLPKPPEPKIIVDPAVRLNRATGLYEQKVTVKNVAARAIWGFDVTVSGLGSGVSLFNGTAVKTNGKTVKTKGMTVKKGGGTISWREPLEAGGKVVMVLKYYSTARGPIPQPGIVVKGAAPAGAAKKKPVKIAAVKAAAAAAVTPVPQPFAISRMDRAADGSISLEFPTTQGETYRLQYSSDAVHWNTCTETISGDGSSKQWTDSGPPSTESHPMEESRRFYRVERLGTATPPAQ